MTLIDLFNQIADGTNKTACEFDLTTITMVGGGIIRLSNADFDISYNGNRYSAGGVLIDQRASRTQAHWKVGLDVDQWVVVVMPRPFDPVTGALFPDVIGDVPWIQAAPAALDGADFQVDRVWFSAMPTWPMPGGGAAPVGGVTIFAGLVAEIDTTESIVALTVNDYRDYLSISMPRHTWQGQCRHMLFDAGCNADGNMQPGFFRVDSAIGAGSNKAMIVAPTMVAPPGSGTFTLGRIQVTSGLNSGFHRTVIAWDGAATLRLINPLPFDLQVGDAFSAFPGCDKTQAACALFGNTINFGGQPNIPTPETAI